MKKCDLTFGSEECLLVMKKDECLDKCQHIQKLSLEEIADIMIEFLMDDSEILRAKKSPEVRERVIKKMSKISDNVVNAIIRSVDNARIKMEAEDIKATVLMTINFSIDSFDMTKSSFGTHLRWAIKGEVANILRKFKAKKREVDYWHISSSLQDEIGTEGTEDIKLEDLLGEDDNNFEIVEIKQFIEQLTEDEQQVIKLLLHDCSAKEIFNLIGVPVIIVHEIIASLREKTTRYFKKQ